MTDLALIIQHLEQSIASDSSAMRLEALTRVSDLFLIGSGRPAEERTASCDRVLQSLIDTIEAQTAMRLAGSAKRKAMHVPVDRLKTCGDVVPLTLPAERRRIPGRSSRKSRPEGASQDLLRQTGFFEDMPRHDFMKMLSLASTEVRARLLASNPHAIDINAALAEITAGIGDRVRSHSSEHARAVARIKRRQRTGQFGEADLHAHASTNDFEATAIALAAFGDFRIDLVERALLDRSKAPILILARSAQLCRTTVRAILTMRAAGRALLPADLMAAMAQFDALRLATARSALEFHHLRRHADSKPHIPADLALEWYVQSIPVQPLQAKSG